MVLDYELVEKVIVSDNLSDNSSESVPIKVPTPPRVKKYGPTSTATPVATNSKKVASKPVKKAAKSTQKVPVTKKQKTSQRYDASSSSYTKFYDEHRKYMWDFVCKRKIMSERLIHVDDHVKTGVYKLLDDQKLLGTITMAKNFNKEIVLEFYANFKFDISVVKSPNYHKVTVRSRAFDFSPKVISDYLNCEIVKSHRM